MDCLVANETLQFTETDRIHQKSPEIRKITKRASFVSQNNFKRGTNVRSFCNAKTVAARRGKEESYSLLNDCTNKVVELVSHTSSPV